MKMENPIVTFEMENGDIMKAELYPETAPNTEIGRASCRERVF